MDSAHLSMENNCGVPPLAPGSLERLIAALNQSVKADPAKAVAVADAVTPSEEPAAEMEKSPRLQSRLNKAAATSMVKSGEEGSNEFLGVPAIHANGGLNRGDGDQRTDPRVRQSSSDNLGIVKDILNRWKNLVTKRKDVSDKSTMYRKGPAPIDEAGPKKRKMVMRCTHGTLDSDVEDLGEDCLMSNGKHINIASSRGLILYFAKMAVTKDESESIDLQFVYSLLQSGADINFADKHGQTIFHEVARAWHTDVAKFMLHQGADINKGDRYGRTPLHLSSSVGYVEMIEFLVKNGASTNARTKEESQTPIYYAAKNNMVASLRVLLKLGADINDRDYKMRTPLFVAAESGRSEAARFLLEAGAPAAVYDDHGNSCLSLMVEKMPQIAKIALEQFHSFDRALRKQYYYLNYLEKHGADVSSESHDTASSAHGTLSSGAGDVALRPLVEVNNKNDTLVMKPVRIAKTALEVVVQYSELDLVMHPAIHRLLTVKWDLFGKWSSIQMVIFNLFYTMIWTVLGLLMPRGDNYYSPMLENWWRLTLEILGCALTLYFILQTVLDAKKVEKLDKNYKTWRSQQIRRDMFYCHPRWPEEHRYLQGELERIHRNTQGNYFRNAWNIYEWITYGGVLAMIITRLVSVLIASSSDIADKFHRQVMSVALIFLWLRLMKSCRAFRSLGPFITLLGHVISDTLKFVFLYFEFFIPYVCAFWIMFGGAENADLMAKQSKDYTSWRNLNDLVYSVYLISLGGDVDWEGLAVVDRTMAQILVGTYLAAANVVCLNLFIALMSDTFTRVYENAKANAVMQQAQHVLNVERALSKEKRLKVEQYIESECAPLEVYCEVDFAAKSDTATDEIKHHVDNAIESVKDMLHEMKKEHKTTEDRSLETQRGLNNLVGALQRTTTEVQRVVSLVEESDRHTRDLAERLDQLRQQQDNMLEAFQQSDAMRKQDLLVLRSFIDRRNQGSVSSRPRSDDENSAPTFSRAPALSRRQTVQLEDEIPLPPPSPTVHHHT